MLPVLQIPSWMIVLREMLVIVLTTEMFRTVLEMLHYPHLFFFVVFTKKKLKKLAKKKKNPKKNYFFAVSNRFSWLILCELSSSILVFSFLLIFFRAFIMSDSIELFEPEGLIPNDLRPPNFTFRPRRARRNNKRAVAVYQNANKHVATESIDNVSTKKSMRLSIEFNSSHRFLMRLDDGKGPSPVSSRLDDVLPTDKQSFHTLKERLEIQKARKLNVDTDNSQFIKFLKYGIRRDHNEWSFAEALETTMFLTKNLTALSAFPQTLTQILL